MKCEVEGEWRMENLCGRNDTSEKRFESNTLNFLPDERRMNRNWN